MTNQSNLQQNNGSEVHQARFSFKHQASLSEKTEKIRHFKDPILIWFKSTFFFSTYVNLGMMDAS